MTPPPDAAVLDKVQTYLRRSGLEQRGARAVALTGDASDRRYFRILASGMTSIVLAVYAEPFKFGQLSFVNVAELFLRMPVPIPSILGHEDDLGILALEDLGDVTLQAHLGAAPHPSHMALYREAVHLIAVIQRRGQELASQEFVPYAVAFDIEKLTWEMDFFIKHYIEGYRGQTIPSPQRAALRQELKAIVEELAAEPRVLCHRDYHSRNLMLHQERLVIIDFQDARMGPDTYDLVSLLRDSYVDLSDQTVDVLVAYFLALTGRPKTERAFRRRFDLMALQRNLKALGTFGYQTNARRNPVYIQYMPRTLRYVRDNLKRHRRHGRLRELLAGCIDELG